MNNYDFVKLNLIFAKIYTMTANIFQGLEQNQQ